MITTAMKNHLRECVARGVAILNEKRPGWASEVMTTELEMESCKECVLGQLYGDYINGLTALRITFGHDYGFNVSGHDVKAPQLGAPLDVHPHSMLVFEAREIVMEELKKMWTKTINKRREEHAWEPKVETVSGMPERV